MPTYQPGKNIHQIKKGQNKASIAKLNSNELTYPPAPSITQTLNNNIKILPYYPDDSATTLRNKIAEINNINSHNILITAGSSEAIALSISACTRENDEVITSTHAFQLYKISTDQQNRKLILVDETKEWSQNLQGILDKISQKTQLIFISNPSNPLGTWIKHDLLMDFLRRVPKHITVVIDEAYFEFMEHEDFQSTSHLIDTFPNILITRTFSKLYGLASLRIGYAIGSTAILKKLNAKKLPFSVNSCAINCALQTLNEIQYYQGCKHKIISTRDHLYMQLSSMGYQPLANSANFLTIHTGPNTSSLIATLEDQSIFIRGLSNYNLNEYIRISIGTTEEIELFIKHFQQEVTPIMSQ